MKIIKKFFNKTKNTACEERVIMPVSNNPGRFVFYCPGCNANHLISTVPIKNKPYHVLTGTFSKPTIRASILSNPNNEPDAPRCHSYVTRGKIEFLRDCAHQLAGKTVKLKPL